MTRKVRRNKRKTLRKRGKRHIPGGMVRQSLKTVGSLTGSLIKEVTNSKAQDAFKEQVKSWENSRENKENVRNISVKNMPKMEI